MFLPKAQWLKLVTAIASVWLAGNAAYGVSNWAAKLSAYSRGEPPPATTISNLTVSATATHGDVGVLYPGSDGDVVVTIANPNPFPVAITAVNLPTDTTYGAGFTTSGLGTAKTGCSSTSSDVMWSHSTATSGTLHILKVALVVGALGQADNPLVVTLTSDVYMAASAPSACEGAYFSMPAFTSIAAHGVAASSTPGPTADSWTK